MKKILTKKHNSTNEIRHKKWYKFTLFIYISTYVRANTSVKNYEIPNANVKSGQYLVPPDFYRGADKSLTRPTSRCILSDGENISFDASLVIYIVLIFLQL